MMKRDTLAFANINPFGSPFAAGPDNTHEVLAFTSRADRDRFVRDSQDLILSVRAVTSREAFARVKPDWDGQRWFRTPDDGDLLSC
jgi:hypothetical protein